MKKRLFGILLSLTLMMSMMPALGLTAYADNVAEKGTKENPWYVGTNGSSDVTAWLDTDGTLHIQGEGPMDGSYGQTTNRPPYETEKDSIIKVEKERSVTSIGPYAFYGYTSLQQADIPDTYEINESAFENCTNLKTVNISGYNKRIDERAFCNCGMESITISSIVEQIARETFKDCKDLGSVVFERPSENRVLAIYQNAFSGNKEGAVLKFSGDGSSKLYFEGTEIQDNTLLSELNSKAFKWEVPSVTKYPLWVDGIQVTGDNTADVLGDGTVKYNDTTHTLTLGGATITESYTVHDVKLSGIRSEIDSGLIIDVESDSSVDVEDALHGIYSKNALTIQGNGKLDVKGKDGIASKNSSVTIKNISVNSTCTGIGEYKAAIYASGKISIENAAVTAENGLEAGIESVNAAVTIDNSTVNANGGAYGINGNTVTISGSNTVVNAEATVTGGSAIIGINGITLNDDLSIIEPVGGKIGKGPQDSQISRGKYTVLTADGKLVQKAKIYGEDNWAGLQEKLNAGGTVKLDQDYTAGESDTALVVPEGKEVILDLNGHTIDRGLAEAEAKEDGNVITVNANGKLTIKDSSKEKTGTITGGRNNGDGGGVFIGRGASLVMDGGTISGNSAKPDGGGVFLDDGAAEFIMNGGTITGNYADSDGGGVAVYYGTFTMNGGTISSNNCDESGAGVYINDKNSKFILNKGSIISSNKANDGGGVFIESGDFTMNDGTISENTAGDEGGGVFIYFYECKFSMKGGSIEQNKTLGTGKYCNGGGICSVSEIELSGGSISGNTAEGSGGGVFADNDISITGCTIDSNTADDDGGGVYVTKDSKFTMTGASSIENNKCDGDGGGVAFYGEDFTMDSGTISGNTADSDGGGVYVAPDSKFTMTGTSSITNNKSDDEGGGVFANGQFVMDGSKATISGNTAGIRGGGISSDNDDPNVVYVVIKEGIIKDNTADCEGGGLYVRNTCTMNGGSITGNKALGTDDGEGGGGVSVCAGNDDIFTMTGGTIKDNTAVNNGGGVNVEASSYLPVSNGILVLSGNPVIENNLITSGKEQNVFLGKEKSVRIADKLESGASVGVTMETPGIITTGYKAHMADADPAAFFTSDDKNYSVLKDENGEAKLDLIDIKTVGISIAPPVCGDTIKIKDYKYPEGAQPQVTVPEGAHYSVALMDDGKTQNAYWGTIIDGSYETLDDGTKLEGGQTYKALVYIKADPGYKFAGDAKVTVNGEDDPMFNHTEDHQLRVYWDLTATHKLSRTAAKASSCTKEGNIEYWTCDVCSKFFSDAEGKTEITEADTKTEVLGHEIGEAEQKNRVEATCGHIGGYDVVKKCTRCNEVIMITHVVIPRQGHNWSEWDITKAATENEDGERTRTCSVGGETQKEVIPAKGHIHEMVQVEEVPATCTVDGIAAHWECTKCHNNYADKNGNTQLTTDQLVIAATGHKPGDVMEENKTESTCTEAGYHDSVVYCKSCNEELIREKVRDESPLGHDWSEWTVTREASVYEEGEETRICSRCDEQETRPIPKLDPQVITPTVTVGNQVYTGRALTPAVTVRNGTELLKNGTDYTVTYSNNTNVGRASAKVMLKGRYSGSATANFNILPKKAGISKITPGKKQMKVTMSSKVSATGGSRYQIQYRVKGKGKWKTKTAKTRTKKIKKLKKGKRYEVRVRAYKSVDGTKYYGEWSKVKTSKKIR